LREDILSAPESPGVYIFKRSDSPLYVGKAKNLRKRLMSYLKPRAERVASMLSKADSLEIIPTQDEVSATVLEANLIRRLQPPYNVRLKDGNPFLYLALTSERYPRVVVSRKPLPGVENYGPFLRRKHLREFLRFARRMFPVRNCSLKLPSKRRRPPCVEYHIGRCLAPCAYDVGEEYGRAVEGFRKLLKGDSREVLSFLYENMQREAERYNYEMAAVWRDRLRTFREVLGRRREGTRDMWVVRSYEGHTVIALYTMVGDNITDAHTFHVSPSVEGDGATLREFLNLYYERNLRRPEEIVAWPPPEDSEVHGIPLRAPGPDEEGILKALLNYASERLEGVIERRERVNPALMALREVLRLPEIPRRVEGYDISHLFGEHRVGSVVVFYDGRPLRAEYRRYRIRETEGIDDYSAMYEVVKRRLRRLKEEGGAPPDLLLIDGGLGQVRAALKAMREVGLDVPLVGLAKRLETLHLPDGEVIQLPISSPALRLLMRVRDEAHRFALKYHRNLRKKRLSKSILDDIPGIGPKRKRALLSYFGSVERIREASVEEIASLPGFSVKLARKVKDFLEGKV